MPTTRTRTEHIDLNIGICSSDLSSYELVLKNKSLDVKFSCKKGMLQELAKKVCMVLHKTFAKNQVILTIPESNLDTKHCPAKKLINCISQTIHQLKKEKIQLNILFKKIPRKQINLKAYIDLREAIYFIAVNDLSRFTKAKPADLHKALSSKLLEFARISEFREDVVINLKYSNAFESEKLRTKLINILHSIKDYFSASLNIGLQFNVSSIQKQKTNKESITYYTDGSLITPKDPVEILNAGIAFLVENSDECFQKSFKVRNDCANINDIELMPILYAMKDAHSKWKLNPSRISILSDSQAAVGHILSILVSLKCYLTHLDGSKQSAIGHIKSLLPHANYEGTTFCEELRKQNITLFKSIFEKATNAQNKLFLEALCVKWIKGHADCEYNKKVDRLAKCAAKA